MIKAIQAEQKKVDDVGASDEDWFWEDVNFGVGDADADGYGGVVAAAQSEKMISSAEISSPEVSPPSLVPELKLNAEAPVFRPCVKPFAANATTTTAGGGIGSEFPAERSQRCRARGRHRRGGRGGGRGGGGRGGGKRKRRK
jgi:hypothetical protein